ncbi:MAG: hypothetical protein WCX80_00215 [Patescibacteria group bacterium]
MKDPMEEIRDRQWLAEITSRARELGDGYTPSLYFEDLLKIEMRKRHDSIYYTINTNDFISSLHQLNMERREKLQWNGDEAGMEKFWEETSIAQKKFDAVVDPGKEARLAQTKREFRDGTMFKKVLSWLWRCYTKNFFLALVLLYLWWVEEREKWRINNPLSFIICLLIYPYTIIRTLLRKLDYQTRQWAMEIAFRRTEKTIFTLISEDEMAIIKKFAAKGQIKNYKEYLNARGLVVRHSFLSATLVTIILLLIVPRPQSLANNLPTVKGAKYFIEIKAPPGIQTISTMIINAQDWDKSEAILTPDNVDIVWEMEKILYDLIPKISQGFVKTLDPIPLSK